MRQQDCTLFPLRCVLGGWLVSCTVSQLCVQADATCRHRHPFILFANILILLNSLFFTAEALILHACLTSVFFFSLFFLLQMNLIHNTSVQHWSTVRKCYMYLGGYKTFKMWFIQQIEVCIWVVCVAVQLLDAQNCDNCGPPVSPARYKAVLHSCGTSTVRKGGFGTNL